MQASRTIGIILLLALLLSAVLGIVLISVQWVRSSSDATPTVKKSSMTLYEARAGQNSGLVEIAQAGEGAAKAATVSAVVPAAENPVLAFSFSPVVTAQFELG